MKSRFTILTFGMLLSYFAISTFSTSNQLRSEKNGQTGKIVAGCSENNSCHGAANSNTKAVLSSVSGNTTIAINSKIDLKMTITNTAGMKTAGMDIGVKTTTTGNTGTGTLAVTNGTGVKYVSGAKEITHSSPITMTNGTKEITFSWTAPAKAGTYFLRGIGLAGNGNNSESGDQWNYADALPIIVTDGASISSDNNFSNFKTYPNPAKDFLIIENEEFETKSGSLEIYDNTGTLLTSMNLPNQSNFKIDLANINQIVSTGHYNFVFKYANQVFVRNIIISK